MPRPKQGREGTKAPVHPKPLKSLTDQKALCENSHDCAAEKRPEAFTRSLPASGAPLDKDGAPGGVGDTWHGIPQHVCDPRASGTGGDLTPVSSSRKLPAEEKVERSLGATPHQAARRGTDWVLEGEQELTSWSEEGKGVSARGSSKRGGLEASRGTACVRLRLGGLRRQAKDPAPCPQSSG